MSKISSVESSRLAVTYRPLGDLIPDQRNARTHPKRQIEQISKTAQHKKAAAGLSQRRLLLRYDDHRKVAGSLGSSLTVKGWIHR
jgi:hypothetical protein